MVLFASLVTCTDQAGAAITVTPAPNPPFPGKCGLNLALDFDLSNSITTPQFNEMRQASVNVVTALQGTPSQVGVYSFATFAPATNGSGGTVNHPTIPGNQPTANFALPATSIATAVGATTVNQRIAGLTRVASASGGTNWDQGLSQLLGTGHPHYDAVLFITDGDPTTHGPNNAGTGTGTTDADVNAAITSANAVKASGTRVIAVGVSDTTGPSVARLQLISGTTANSDYFVTNYDALEETLVQVATASCRGTVTVVKQIRNLDGTVSPGGDWQFSATNSAGSVTPTNGTTSSQGTLNFSVPDNSTSTITETQQSGYQLVQQAGMNAFCTSGGNPVTSTNVGPTGFSVPIGSQQIVSCLVTNALIPATLTLVKNVNNPFGGNAAPDDWLLSAAGGPTPISGPSGAPEVTGALVAPGTYSLAESDGPAGYAASAWTCVGGTQSGPQITLTPGAVATCSITNTELGVPQLVQNKNVDSTLAIPGDILTYTMTVANTGTANATSVTATETLPTQVTFVSATTSAGTYDSATGIWTVGNVAAGATETLTVTATVNAGTEGSTAVDRFEVQSPPGVAPPEVENPCTDNAAQSCADTDIVGPPAAPELVQSKAVDQSIASPGDAVTYTMQIANVGTANATGVTATDTLPAGVTFATADTHGSGTFDPVSGIWTVGTLASDEIARLTITATVNPGTEGTTQVNRFVITSTGIPVDVEDACTDVPTESCASTEIPGAPALTQNKVVDQASAGVGATLTYTMTVSNTGTADATGVSASDLVPEQVTFVSANTNGAGTYDPSSGTWAIGTIGIGATVTLTITATINADAAASTIINAFQVDNPPEGPPITVENPCPAPDQNASCAATVVPGTPQLVQSKVVDQMTAKPGSQLTYTMAVTNTGTAEATGVVAQDTLPSQVTFISADTGGAGTYDPGSGTWSAGTVGVGTTVTLAIVVSINAGTENSVALNRFSTNGGGGPDPVVEQPCVDQPSQSCAETLIPGTPALVAGKTVNAASAAVGATLVYTINVKNVGNGDATDSTLTDNLPAGLSFVSANPNGVGTFDTTTLAWTIPLLSPGQAASLTLSAMVLPSAAGATLVNALSVSAPPGSDPTVITNPCSTNPNQACAPTVITAAGAAGGNGGSGGTLPVTGLDLEMLLGAALVLLLGGVGLVLTAHTQGRQGGLEEVFARTKSVRESSSRWHRS